MRYGLFDTKSRAWMGDENGAITFRDEQWAAMCVQTLNESYNTAQFEVKLYNDTAPVRDIATLTR
jgi:hypothetical protein